MYISIIVMILLVSTDALFIGMSLKLQKGFKLYYLFVISSIILAMCIFAYFIGGILARYIEFETSWVVGSVFLLLAIRNLFAKDEDKMILSMGTIVALGLVMSIDGIVATVVLAIEHKNIFLTPILATAGHLLFLLIGSFSAKFIKTSHKMHNIISASCLFIVSILNFMELL